MCAFLNGQKSTNSISQFFYLHFNCKAIWIRFKVIIERASKGTKQDVKSTWKICSYTRTATSYQKKIFCVFGSH